ncbi:MAG: (Fe-S)-binding protein, partial [Armatimonadota bacterium]
MDIRDYRKEIEKCVKCGTCTATCTVYKDLLMEASGTRGKLALIDAYLKGELELTDTLIDRLKKCTYCLKCMHNCPNGIKLDEILFLFWHEVFKKKGLNLFKNTIFYKLLLNKGYVKLFTFFNKHFSFLATSKNKEHDTQRFYFTDRNLPMLNYMDIKQG